MTEGVRKGCQWMSPELSDCVNERDSLISLQLRLHSQLVHGDVGEGVALIVDDVISFWL